MLLPLLIVGSVSAAPVASELSLNLTSLKSLYLDYLEYEPFTASYNVFVYNVDLHRTHLRNKNHTVDSCRSYFLHTYETEMIPRWKGTKWDYNGYTNEPGADKLIACGYFISTTLKHMGFKWNRYTLAKMYSTDIVLSMCDTTELFMDTNELLDDVMSRGDNLFVLGLDNHVGLLLKRDSRLWFVHSNYIDLEGPTKEIARQSEALKASTHYYLGTFLTEKNINRWLSGETFELSEN